MDLNLIYIYLFVYLFMMAKLSNLQNLRSFMVDTCVYIYVYNCILYDVYKQITIDFIDIVFMASWSSSTPLQWLFPFVVFPRPRHSQTTGNLEEQS